MDDLSSENCAPACVPPPRVLNVDLEATQCFLCGKGDDGDNETVLEQCPECNLVWYCCRDHLEIHRPENKCFPFVIKTSETQGRYMVAVRDIAPLEMILKESPSAVGPYSKQPSGCLQCFRRVPKGAECHKCGFPVCNRTCAQGELHQIECAFLADKRRRARKESRANGRTQSQKQQQRQQQCLDSSCDEISDLEEKLLQMRKTEEVTPESLYVCITPLRMLLKKRCDPKAFARINLLKDHVQDSSPSKSQINLQLLKLILILRDSRDMVYDYPQSDIRKMIGILKTNGMTLEPRFSGEQGCPGVALYPIYCLINHACFNNTNYVKFPDHHLELRSQIPIKRGEEISTRYISSTLGNVRRREDIQRYWYFNCTCLRCLDVTEMGTYMSAIRCNHCEQGFLVPTDPISYEPDWKCSACSAIVSNMVIDEVISTIERQVGEADGTSIDQLEEMYFHFQNIFHPNHYILVDLMHNLVHLYTAKSQLTRPEKERKIQLCFLVLDVLSRVDPGFTKWRGTLLQELIHPLMMVSKEDHAAGRISEREFDRRLSFCSRKLKEARLCLYGGFTSVDEYVSNREDRKKKLLAELQQQKSKAAKLTKS